MSITDATTSLSLTWTEHPVVTFTAGSLSAISDCVTYIETHLRRGTISASSTPTTTEVNLAFIRAKQELLATKSYTFSRRYAYASTTAGTYRYALPPDFQHLKGLRDMEDDRDLVIWPNYIFNVKFPDPSAESNDEPKVATVKNMELWLGRPANDTRTLEIEYERSGDDNTATDVSWLPQLERFRCCDFAIADLLNSLGEDDRANLYWARWKDGLIRSRKTDGKKRWRSRIAGISLFQEFAARAYAEDPED